LNVCRGTGYAKNDTKGDSIGETNKNTVCRKAALATKRLPPEGFHEHVDPARIYSSQNGSRSGLAKCEQAAPPNSTGNLRCRPAHSAECAGGRSVCNTKRFFVFASLDVLLAWSWRNVWPADDCRALGNKKNGCEDRGAGRLQRDRQVDLGDSMNRVSGRRTSIAWKSGDFDTP